MKILKKQEMKLKSILLTAAATISLATATMAQVPNYVPTNGLVGWWPFNGNANDESGTGNNGTVNGATLTTDRFGNSNKAYNFNGASWISVPDASSLDFTTSFTIAAWFKPSQFNTQVPPFTASNHIVSKIRTPAGGHLYHLGIENSQNNFLYGGAFNSSNDNMYAFSPSTINLNNWYFGTITYDGSTLNLYLNGVFQDSSNSVMTLLNSSEPLQFGRVSANDPTREFFGNIDDIGLWNRALSQQEITDLYNGNICFQTITVTDTLIINMGITGFNPITYGNTIKIFPNPTNDHITIDYGNFASLNGYQLKIINSLSQQVFQTNITQQSNYLNLTTWGGNGLYFVQIIDPQGNIIDIRKIVLQ